MCFGEKSKAKKLFDLIRSLHTRPKIGCRRGLENTV